MLSATLRWHVIVDTQSVASGTLWR